MAMTVLGLAKPRDHRRRWFFAGCVAAISFLVAGGGEIDPSLGRFVALFGPLGALAVLAGIDRESR